MSSVAECSVCFENVRDCEGGLAASFLCHGHFYCYSCYRGWVGTGARGTFPKCVICKVPYGGQVSRTHPEMVAPTPPAPPPAPAPAPAPAPPPAPVGRGRGRSAPAGLGRGRGRGRVAGRGAGGGRVAGAGVIPPADRVTVGFGGHRMTFSMDNMLHNFDVVANTVDNWRGRGDFPVNNNHKITFVFQGNRLSVTTEQLSDGPENIARVIRQMRDITRRDFSTRA